MIVRMPDPEWFAASKSPAQVRQPKPGERVWTLRKSGRQVDGELRFHGESYGWEFQRLHDGELSYGQRFVLKADAMREADWHRERLLQEGWTLPGRHAGGGCRLGPAGSRSRTSAASVK
jgi:hypothetical protein